MSFRSALYGPSPSVSANRALVGQSLWTGIDQAACSATNFLAGVLVARSGETDFFGACTVTLAVYNLVLGFGRAFVAAPAIIEFDRALLAPGSKTIETVAGGAVVFGLLCALAIGGMSWGVGPVLYEPMAVLALFAFGLALQDCGRGLLVAQGRARAAAANDIVWFVSLALSAFGVARSGSDPAQGFFFAWAASGAACGVLALVQLGAKPALGRGGAWLRASKRRGLGLAYDFAMGSGTNQVLIVFLPAVAGLATAGAVRGAILALGPVLVLSQALGYFGLPLVKRYSEGDMGLARSVSLVASALAAAIVAWTLLVLGLPDWIGSEVLGETWNRALPLLPWIALVCAANGYAMLAGVGLRILDEIGRLVWLRTWLFVPSVGIPLAGAVVWHDSGFGAGFAVASLLAAGAAWALFKERVRAS